MIHCINTKTAEVFGFETLKNYKKSGNKLTLLDDNLSTDLAFLKVENGNVFVNEIKRKEQYRQRITSATSNHQTIKPSNHQTIKPSNHQIELAPFSPRKLAEYTTKTTLSKFALKNDATAVRKLQAEADDKNISVEQLTSLILSKHFNVFRASQQLNIAEKKALADIKAANSKNELEIIITNFEKWSKKDESPNLKTVQIIRRMETNFRK